MNKEHEMRYYGDLKYPMDSKEIVVSSSFWKRDEFHPGPVMIGAVRWDGLHEPWREDTLNDLEIQVIDYMVNPKPSKR